MCSFVFYSILSREVILCKANGCKQEQKRTTEPGPRMNVFVAADMAAAIPTGCRIELRASEIGVVVATGCSAKLEMVSSLGMHTRSPISRICAELYGTATMRPLLMHTPPCLPRERIGRLALRRCMPDRWVQLTTCSLWHRASRRDG